MLLLCIATWNCSCLFSVKRSAAINSNLFCHCFTDTFHSGPRERQIWEFPGPPSYRKHPVQRDPSNAVPTFWEEQKNWLPWVSGAGHRFPSCHEKTTQTAKNKSPNSTHQKYHFLIFLILSLILIFNFLFIPNVLLHYIRLFFSWELAKALRYPGSTPATDEGNLCQVQKQHFKDHHTSSCEKHLCGGQVQVAILPGPQGRMLQLEENPDGAGG